MARTIGRKNADRVIEETKHQYAMGNHEGCDTDFVSWVSTALYDRLPEMFDIWESAHEEIDRIIWDTYGEIRREERTF